MLSAGLETIEKIHWSVKYVKSSESQDKNFLQGKVFGEEGDKYVEIVDDEFHELFLEYVDEGRKFEDKKKTEDSQGTLLSDDGACRF
ncbi:unnamed protein product [Dovyalis caffra]|uniref:Uncharacterized protein n=1 Tax=Dovyalis caffra TaxID=77055 RepID=A0AAV1S3U0_9ROSI|nr:unnamed protein product [Dovyalis caffra]